MNKKFVSNATRFLAEARKGSFPNAPTFAKQIDVSEKTVSRLISKLRDELGAPLEYDASEKGYYLKDTNYSLPVVAISDRDELAALLVARDLISSVEAEDLVNALNRVWERVCPRGTQFGRDLELLAECYTSDLTVVGALVERGVLEYVDAAVKGESVQLSYKSPWKHPEPVTLEGHIEHVHFSDGNLYIQFFATDGHVRILNCSFIKGYNILDRDLTFAERVEDERVRNWRKGFGIWAGEDLHTVRIEILSPAAEYYAAQRWHSEQEDTWDGDVLVRCFPSILSPELERRILSIGRFVRTIEPAALKESVCAQLQAMQQQLS